VNRRSYVTMTRLSDHGRSAERDILPGRHGLEPRMQVGLACLKFAGERIGRFDGDLPHPVPRAGPVSHERYAGPGCGLP
jgi:hypothetical protein